MWAFYIENNWFYTTEDYVIKRLTFPAPNATALGLPEAAPGQTANYLGWKIVESYLRRYPETTIDDLLKQDAQKTLELSKFKPKNK
jgi:lipoprotein NlpI